jgi:hypothetical protein
VRVLLHQEDRVPLVAELADDPEQLPHQQGRQAQGRFVQEQDLGPRHEGPAEGQHLLLAPGQGGRHLTAALPQAREQGVHLLQVLLHLPLPSAAQPQVGAQEQVVLHPHGPEQLPALRDVGDPGGHHPLGGPARDVLAVEADVPGAGWQQPGDDPQQRGLARAVGADHRRHPTRGDFHRHLPQGQQPAVACTHPDQLKHRPPRPGKRPPPAGPAAPLRAVLRTAGLRGPAPPPRPPGPSPWSCRAPRGTP